MIPSHRGPLLLVRLMLVAVVALASAPHTVASATTPGAIYTITGGGWGHGIGLSQYGAKGYAERGWPHDDILRWFFGADRTGEESGVRVATLGSLGKYANPWVRVNIDASNGTRQSWELRGWKARLRLLDESTSTPIHLDADTYHDFSVRGGMVSVNGQTYRGTVRLRSEPTTGVSTPLIVVKTASGPFSRAFTRYRGDVQLSVVGGKLRAVNALPLEWYLYGVVPRESPSSWHIEALKAQAVAARSYAWGRNPPSSATSAWLSGVLHCTVYSQVYGGHSRLRNGKDTDVEAYETANKAVNDTRGQVVYHAPTKTVVTTYFSSSSGGHTANIEDVWVSASPKPYYRGVADADAANPNFTWGPIEKTGAQLADQLRTKDMADGRRDYSVASPAFVTAVAQETAGSGHARYVTFRWSNGATFRMRGDTVRSVFGLKSSKFVIAGPSWGAAVQETDDRIAWSGRWIPWVRANHSAGRAAYSSTKDAAAHFSFTGTGFKWYAPRSPKGGRAEVVIDGKRVAVVSLYAPTYQYRRVVYTATGLSIEDTHTATIRLLRTKVKASGGYAAGVDALRVQAGELVTVTVPAASATR